MPEDNDELISILDGLIADYQKQIGVEEYSNQYHQEVDTLNNETEELLRDKISEIMRSKFHSLWFYFTSLIHDVDDSKKMECYHDHISRTISLLEGKKRAYTRIKGGEKMTEGEVSSASGMSTVNPRNVFVVHGRNIAARNALFEFLGALDLHPIEWIEAIKATDKPTPYVGEILDAAFSGAQAVVVLMTPDDIAKLEDKYVEEGEKEYETELTGQARPNVLFEAGMAMGRNSDRTILIEFGDLRPFSDIGGRHVVKLVDSPESRNDIAQRLIIAGCPCKMESGRWIKAGNFAIEPVEVKKNETEVLGVVLSDDFNKEIIIDHISSLRDVNFDLTCQNTLISEIDTEIHKVYDGKEINDEEEGSIRQLIEFIPEMLDNENDEIRDSYYSILYLITLFDKYDFLYTIEEMCLDKCKKQFEDGVRHEALIKVLFNLGVFGDGADAIIDASKVGDESLLETLTQKVDLKQIAQDYPDICKTLLTTSQQYEAGSRLRTRIMNTRKRIQDNKPKRVE